MIDQFGNIFNYFTIGPTIIWFHNKEEWYYIKGKRYTKEEYYNKIKE